MNANVLFVVRTFLLLFFVDGLVENLHSTLQHIDQEDHETGRHNKAREENFAGTGTFMIPSAQAQGVIKGVHAILHPITNGQIQSSNDAEKQARVHRRQEKIQTLSSMPKPEIENYAQDFVGGLSSKSEAKTIKRAESLSMKSDSNMKRSKSRSKWSKSRQKVWIRNRRRRRKQIPPTPSPQPLCSTTEQELFQSMFIDESLSLQLAVDDTPMISFSDGGLKLLLCADPSCHTLPDIVVLATQGRDPSLQIDVKGNAVVSYYDGSLKLIICDGTGCNSPLGPIVLDDQGDVGRYNSLQLDANGNAVISYHDTTNNVMKLVRCTDPQCSTLPTPTVIDNAVGAGLFTSLQLDSNDNPMIAYYDGTNHNLKFIRCEDPYCLNGPNPIVLDSLGSVGFFASLQLDASDNPVISYLDVDSLDLKLVKCGNPDCTIVQTPVVLDRGGAFYLSLQLDAQSNPVISYVDAMDTGLKLLKCRDQICTPPHMIFVHGRQNGVASFPPLQLDTAGNAIVSHFEVSSGSLNLSRIEASCFN